MSTPRELGRREFMAATAAGALIPNTKSRPVSYLVIPADQLTWWMCDPAQRGLLDLPNIDRLRAEGTIFERCYSTSPLCKPARGTLRTGLFPHSNSSGPGLVQPADTVEFRLREAGLVTRYFGKWHQSPIPDPSGFVHASDRLHWDWFVGHESSHTQNVTFVHDDPTPVPTGPWDSGVMTKLAIRAMREDVAEERPFFVQLNYLPPHHPYAIYPKFLSVFSPAEATLRPNLGGDLVAARKTIAHYMNLVRGVDLQVGKLLTELDALGQDVVVVFTSDHGDMLSSHGMSFKRKPFEESVRVPLIVRGPGWSAERITYPVALVDLARTFAGIGQGVPLMDPRESVYLELEATSQPSNNWSGGAWRAVVMDDGWKLALGRNNARVMYDLQSDPYELVDLAGQGSPREDELLARMHEWAQATGDGFFG